MDEPVTRIDENGVAILTLNRPDTLNRLNAEIIAALHAQAERLRTESKDVRCVVLRGAGASFCAGTDIGSESSAGSTLRAIRFRSETMSALATIPQRVIASVHGYCFAGGLELALAADYIIAAEPAQFAGLHAKGGTTPWGLAPRLAERIGITAAKEIALTSRRIDAPQALRLNLIEWCVPAEHLERETLAVANSIAVSRPFRMAI